MSGQGGGSLKPFGAQVKFLRERAGLTQAELGKQIGYSEDQVRSVECGRRFPKPEFVQGVEQVLEAGGVLAVAHKHLTHTRARHPSWFEDFARLEAKAAALYIYENHVVPGLLQTEDYARAVFRSLRPPLDDAGVEGRVSARLERQALLTRTPPATLSVIIEQVVLERWLGGRATMAKQLDHLVECAALPNLELQVMQTQCEYHAGLDGPMQLVETHEQERVVYCEVQRGSLVISDPKDVFVLNQRYGILRSQALNSDESLGLLTRLRGEI